MRHRRNPAHARPLGPGTKLTGYIAARATYYGSSRRCAYCTWLTPNPRDQPPSPELARVVLRLGLQFRRFLSADRLLQLRSLEFPTSRIDVPPEALLMAGKGADTYQGRDRPGREFTVPGPYRRAWLNVQRGNEVWRFQTASDANMGITPISIVEML